MAITNNSVFLYSDTGAVSGSTGRCSGTAGDGALLLNMLLRNGYNWQAVTPANLTRSGTTATLTLTGHGFRNLIGNNAVPQRLALLGSDDAASAFNSDALYYTWVDANTITYTVANSGATTAAATGTSTLNGAISSTTATSLTVSANASFPQSAAFFCKVDSEVMLVTAGWGTNTWTVRRGVCGTTAATHSNGATITNVIYIGVAPAGGIKTPWQNAADLGFTGVTSKDVFRPPGGNRFYLDVDDTQTVQTRIRGYESMTQIATGTNPFPTVAQVAVDGTGACIVKSSAASTTARAWWCVATDRHFYLGVDVIGTWVTTGPTYSGSTFFGDLISCPKSGDAYATLLIGGPSAYSTGDSMYSCSTSSVTGHYLTRAYSQLGTSIGANKGLLDGRMSSSSTMYSGTMTYPYPMDGGIYLSQVLIGESAALPYRGVLPILWAQMHSSRFANIFDTFVGTGQFAGKTFMVVPCSAVSTPQIMLAEVSNTIQAT